MPRPHNPSISHVRAIITTPWGRRGYRPKTITTLESYYVDTALDNDSDAWTLDYADPHGQHLDLFNRDGEIRVQLFGVGQQGSKYILTGMADEVAFTNEGTITMSGRDLSALAVDSTAPPHKWRKQRGWKVVEQQAKALGFSRRNLLHTGKMHNTVYTDGSESYWEFWYRLYRQDKLYLWCEPDGTLVGHGLNYGGNPAYFLGRPHKGDSKHIANKHIPVERLEIHKTTQKRLYEVWVFGTRGEVGFVERVVDSSMNGWHKKPIKVMLDSKSHSPKGGRKVGREEIFEGKVGSIELKATIADPGTRIQTNRIARINLPEIGLFGEYYIVGTRVQASTDGFLQEIRLREKQYAMSQRVPDDPKLSQTRPPQRNSVLEQLAPGISAVANMPEAWGQYFLDAAKEFHGPWDFNLFLATLIGMADVETGGRFANVREQGTIEWYPPPASSDASDSYHHREEAPKRPLDEWKLLFSNSAGSPGNPVNSRSHNAEAGVGPMQLTTESIKWYADDHFKPNFRDQYTGGRWHPEHNIWGGAKHLRNILKSLGDTGQDNLIWSAVSAYNVGHVDISPGSAGYRYMFSVKTRVLHNPGYLKAVADAVAAARQEAANAVDDPVLPSGTSGWSPNHKFIMPLRQATDLNRSEFQGIDDEGAPDRFGRKHHAGKDWYAAGGSNVFSPIHGKIVELTPVDMTDPDHDLSGQIYGGVIKVQAVNGNVWVFRHVRPNIDLKLQQRVDPGAVIATVAKWSDNPASSHAHIEYWITLAGGYNYENMRDPCAVLKNK